MPLPTIPITPAADRLISQRRGDEQDEVTVNRAAKLLRLSIRYVNMMCDEGRIKSRRRTDKEQSWRMIPVAEIKRLQKSQ